MCCNRVKRTKKKEEGVGDLGRGAQEAVESQVPVACQMELPPQPHHFSTRWHTLRLITLTSRPSSASVNLDSALNTCRVTYHHVPWHPWSCRRQRGPSALPKTRGIARPQPAGRTRGSPAPARPNRAYGLRHFQTAKIRFRTQWLKTKIEFVTPRWAAYLAMRLGTYPIDSSAHRLVHVVVPHPVVPVELINPFECDSNLIGGFSFMIYFIGEFILE